MRSRRFFEGDWVVYYKLKHSKIPGPRAADVSPASHGELYSYAIEKYWVIQRILADGRLLLRTRRGKSHIVCADDPNLRRAAWWERWIYKSRFREVELATQSLAA